MAGIIIVWVLGFMAMLSGLLLYPRFSGAAPPSWHRVARIAAIPVAGIAAIVAGIVYGWIWAPPAAALAAGIVTIGAQRLWQQTRSIREQFEEIERNPERRQKFERDPIIGRWLRRRH